jgi:preprotein translocase subunit SecF
MKRVVQFHRAFKATIIISSVIVAASLAGLATLGFNTGVDFQAGLKANVSFVPPSMSVTFTGQGAMALEVAKTKAIFTSHATSGETKAYTFEFADFPTLKAMADAFRTVPGVGVELMADGAIESKTLLGASQSSAELGNEPTILHYTASGAKAIKTSVEKIRAALEGFGSVSIQRIGGEDSTTYNIRVQESDESKQSTSAIVNKLTEELEKSFGKGNVLVNQADFVGAAFSKSLATQAVMATLLAFLGILLYCSIRFKPAYALGAILAIVHDAVVMVGFMVFTRMEFNTLSIAAILTIVGFSINDTIVVYDRIREKVTLNPTASFRDNVNRGVTETLGRTFITNGTVFLAVIALIVFTTGTMKDFSIAILVGEISGTYSTIFIASAFVTLWMNAAAKREAKRQSEQAAASMIETKSAVTKQ